MARWVLAAGLLVGSFLAGCYQPTLRDCTVTCRGADECASGQVCGSDGWCAAPDVAGTCGLVVDGAAADAGRADGPLVDGPLVDGPLVDAGLDARPVDAPGAVLHVLVSGKGKVVVDPLSVECVGPPGDCTYGANPGDDVTLTAVATNGGHAFSDWSTANCQGQGVSCTVTIMAPATTVGATFQ
jgi:hypothetical protein